MDEFIKIFAIISNLSILLTFFFGVYIYYKQSRLSIKLSSSQIVVEIYEQYSSPDFREKRREFGKKLQFHINDERHIVVSDYSRSASLFENLGYLVRTGVLDKGMVLNVFGWAAANYFYILRYGSDKFDYIKAERETWDSALRELEYLYNIFVSENKNVISRVTAQEFIDIEINI